MGFMFKLLLTSLFTFLFFITSKYTQSRSHRKTDDVEKLKF